MSPVNAGHSDTGLSGYFGDNNCDIVIYLLPAINKCINEGLSGGIGLRKLIVSSVVVKVVILLRILLTSTEACGPLDLN